MRKALSLILTLMLLFLLPAAAGASSADSTAKDVWIDNTVDNSVAIVIGQLKLTDNDSGAVTTEEVYREQVKTKYSSDPVVTEDVQQLMIAAASALKNHAAQKGYTVTNNETAVESSNGKVWDNRRYETVEDSDAVLIGDADYLQGAYGIDPGNYTRTHIASGDYGIEHIFTVTLEAALCGLGCEILYRSSPLSFWIAKQVVEIPNIGLPNIVAGRLIEPELLQDDCTPEKIAVTALQLLEPARYGQLQKDLQEVKEKLGEPGAVKRVAELVLRMGRQKQEGLLP